MPILTAIFEAVTGTARMVWAILTASNLIIVGIGLTIAWVLGVLPTMPDPVAPADVLGDQGAKILAAINWFFPIGQVIGTFATMLALYVTFLGVRIVLRWVKAL